MHTRVKLVLSLCLSSLSWESGRWKRQETKSSRMSCWSYGYHSYEGQAQVLFPTWRRIGTVKLEGDG